MAWALRRLLRRGGIRAVQRVHRRGRVVESGLFQGARQALEQSRLSPENRIDWPASAALLLSGVPLIHCLPCQLMVSGMRDAPSFSKQILPDPAPARAAADTAAGRRDG